MAFASNIAAMNAAKKAMKNNGLDRAAFKEYFSIEKHDGEWHAQIIKPFPAPRDPRDSLMDEREGAWAFPMASDALEQAITSGKLHLIGASESDAEAELEAAMAQADAIADSQQSAQALGNGKEWIRVSSVAKPTKFVWHVADEMNAAAAAAGLPAPSRKAVQDECIRRGVASGTARTQYQAWKKACDSASANIEQARLASERINRKS